MTYETTQTEGIKLMMDEHQLILRVLTVMRTACLNLLKTGEYTDSDFRQMIEFVRNFADAHHHGKEEKLLFNRMTEELGPAAEKLVTHGMLVEHDLGRLYIRQLEDALNRIKDDESAVLDIIANAVGYTDLLKRHIDKEDRVAYTFAERHLREETKIEIDKACEAFELEQSEKGIQRRYNEMVKDLEAKYL